MEKEKLEHEARRWFIRCMLVFGLVILLTFCAVWIFDPYFHFHKPFSFVSYRLYDERYINDGISRHFEFNAIITGTSMAQNFKTSEIDSLFGVRCVKETFSGAGYQELSQNLERALKRRQGLKMVIWTMDYNALIRPKDYDQYDEYPEYLYDDDPWNDIAYVFNKTVIYHGVLPNIFKTALGQPSTTFDEYSAWNKETGYGYVMENYDRWEEKAEMIMGLTDEEHQMVTENIQENFVELICRYPDTTFYIFYTPYSICWWDFMNQEGTMQMQFEAELIATELLLQCPNVRLYNFNDRYEVITDLDNYRDKEHYSAKVNSQILEWIASGEGLVTKENYLERLEEEKDFYLHYDYEQIYEGR